MKGTAQKKAYSKAELTKHGLILTTFVFFFGFTKLGMFNKVFFSASKFSTYLTLCFQLYRKAQYLLISAISTKEQQMI